MYADAYTRVFGGFLDARVVEGGASKNSTPRASDAGLLITREEITWPDPLDSELPVLRLSPFHSGFSSGAVEI